ncbi:hypothetical protein CANARDRAFT_232528 [[Candida] arabinofermentans NRRL YB-2248]|uniref:SAM domain-containing protein n=1 Tax=[Candida] arabinofermentans NRRL YB-2248 TaxID=983967 RepID=A0A1E4T1T8_9ASCO|nr:hypothetical protein CANARDRAFT_232528 [[Candida] arabinofermentans NRRL YB-2248]
MDSNQNQQQNSNNNQLLFSPTLSNSSMAVLSPPASRYAFEPSVTTSSIPPISSQSNYLSSPLLNPVSNTSNNNNSISSTRYGSENDVPAFEPNTEAVLQNFTNDLNTFTKWIENLNVEEQKTTMDIFLSSINEEVVHYVKSKIDNTTVISNHGSLVFTPPATNNNIYQPHVRPVSPLLALNSEPATLDSLLNFNSSSSIIEPQPRSQIPHIMKSGFGGLGETISRPRSAGPAYSNLSMTSTNNNDYGQNQYSQQQQQQQQSQSGYYKSSQPQQQYIYQQKQQQPPLQRVFSPDVDPSGFQRRTKEFLDPAPIPKTTTTTTTTINTNTNSNTNSPSSSSSSSNQHQHYGLTSNDFAGQNAIKLNHSLSTITSRSKMDSTKLKGNSSSASNLNSIMMSMSNSTGNGMEDSSTRGRNLMFGRNFQNQSTSLPPVNRYSNQNQFSMTNNTPSSSLYMTSGNNNNHNHGSTTSPSNTPTKLSNYNSAESQVYSPTPRSPEPGGGGIFNNNSNNNNGSNNNNYLKPSPKTPLSQMQPPTSPKSPMPRDIASKTLLNDIPAWLKALRLHKYTENLKNFKWEELLEFDDAKLIEVGVGTIGARNKLLKSFVFVKENLHE